MGCNGSKTVQGAQPQAKGKTRTLLEHSLEKPCASENSNVLLDGPVPRRCLEAVNQAAGGVALRVVQVEGGPIGLWNNRPRTEKVKKGDLVVKVRTAGQSDGKWVEGDEKMMFEILSADGIVELEIRHGLSEAVPQQPPNAGAVVDAGVEAPAPQELGGEMVTGEALADQPAVDTSGEALADQPAVDTSGEAAVPASISETSIVEVAEPGPMTIDANTTTVEMTVVEPSSTKGGCRFLC